MTRFIEKIAQGRKYDPQLVVGYSDDELGKIERLYDIELTGDFGQFMAEMGRSSGGLIGDDPIILYRSAWPVRGQILHQVTFRDDLLKIKSGETLVNKPFSFSMESETNHYFLRTVSGHPERVYCYDENAETVTDTGQSFLEYMQSAVKFCGQGSQIDKYHRAQGFPHVVCRGELLIV